MAYHITLVTNQSSYSVAITNPAYAADSMLIGPGPGSTYTPKRPILINKISGNPSYPEAVPAANNFYTYSDNFCFWDNTNSAVNGIGERSGEKISFNMSGGDLQMTIEKDGTLQFASAATGAAAKAG